MPERGHDRIVRKTILWWCDPVTALINTAPCCEEIDNHDLDKAAREFVEKSCWLLCEKTANTEPIWWAGIDASAVTLEHSTCANCRGSRAEVTHQ